MTNAATEQTTAKSGACGANFAAKLAASVAAGASSAPIAVADKAHRGNPNATVFSSPFTVTSLSFNRLNKSGDFENSEIAQCSYFSWSFQPFYRYFQVLL